MECSKCKVNERTSYSSWCVSCSREYRKKWKKKGGYAKIAKIKSQRRDILKAAKNVPCKDCNKRYPFYVMDFDHVRGTKKHNVGNMPSQSRSIKSTLQEIKKCDIVCANCHRVRTYKRKQHLNDKN